MFYSCFTPWTSHHLEEIGDSSWLTSALLLISGVADTEHLAPSMCYWWTLHWFYYTYNTCWISDTVETRRAKHDRTSGCGCIHMNIWNIHVFVIAVVLISLSAETVGDSARKMTAAPLSRPLRGRLLRFHSFLLLAFQLCCSDIWICKCVTVMLYHPKDRFSEFCSGFLLGDDALLGFMIVWKISCSCCWPCKALPCEWIRVVLVLYSLYSVVFFI